MKRWRFIASYPDAVSLGSSVINAETADRFARSHEEGSTSVIRLISGGQVEASLKLPKNITADPSNWKDGKFSGDSTLLDIVVTAIDKGRAASAVEKELFGDCIDAKTFTLSPGDRVTVRILAETLHDPASWQEVV